MERKAKPPFDPEAFLAKADGGRTISKYQMNQIVFSQGDLADSVFYIHDGKVKVTVISEHGKEAVVAILGLDEFCGEGCLASQPLRMTTATAMTGCEIMRLEKGAIIRVLHANGRIGVCRRSIAAGTDARSRVAICTLLRLPRVTVVCYD